MDEIKEMVEDGLLSPSDLKHLKAYAVNEFMNPNFDVEEDAPMWLSLGTFVNFFGWYFFNGGSAYSLYTASLDPGKIITNTLLCGCAAGCTVYFVKKPIALYFAKCSQIPG